MNLEWFQRIRVTKRSDVSLHVHPEIIIAISPVPMLNQSVGEPLVIANRGRVLKHKSHVNDDDVL
jgi:hypothetical protein